MRKLFSICFIFISVLCFSQQDFLPMHHEVKSFYETHLNKLDVNFHSCVRPYNRREVLLTGADSMLVSFDDFQQKLHLSKNYFYGNELMDSSSKKFNFIALPLVNAGYGKYLSSDTSFMQGGAGAMLNIEIKNKLAFYGEVFTDNSSYPVYQGIFSDSTNIIPAFGYAHETGNGYSYTNMSGYASYTPHKYFNFRSGYGKNFFGDGYRSMLLSDNSYNYPYLCVTTAFWRVKYVNLFAMMNDIRGSNGNPSQFKRKYVSMHFLNWNISRRVSLGIFESIVWQAKDTLLNRQFDVNYLNPFIFFRPVEYSLGSSDNALMGLNLKVKITDNYLIYGQALIDEFLLSQIKADSGWWANKYAFQVGAKFLEPLKIKNLQIQTEFNTARPFTYSHGATLQNYAHYNAPLAHPLGSNFKESVTFIRYSWKKFQFENQTNFSVYGTDSSSLSYGGDVYQSYNNRAQDYHNFIGQGLKNELFFNKFTASWILIPSVNLRLFVSHTYRQLKNENVTKTDNFLHIGISTRLWNSYTDY